MQGFRKPTNCLCPGGTYKAKGHRWRVLQRRQRPQTSQLKCLECGWKWWSKCQYVDKLSDHQERHRSGLTDQDILDRLNENTLLVDLHTAEVVSIISGRRHVLRVVKRESNGTTYNFVKVCRNGRTKKIAVQRLSWMALYRKLVPPDHDVHHIYGKDVPYADAAWNVELVHRSINRAGCYTSDEEEPF